MWNWHSEAWELGIQADASGRFNIGFLISDRLCEQGLADKTALIFRRKNGTEERMAYGRLAVESSRFATFLRELGVKKRDRVFLCSDRIPEAYIAMLGVLKAGAVLGPLFSSFGPEAIRDRLADSGASTLIIQSGQLRKFSAVRRELPALKNIIVIYGEQEQVSEFQDTCSFHEYLRSGSATPMEATFADDPAIMHFTSGTTGRAKGVLHSHRALLAHGVTGRRVLDMHPEDIYLCTADIAWVTGMSYGVAAPLSLGVTQVVPEGNLQPKTVLELVQSCRVSVLYTAPTLLRMMAREKAVLLQSYDVSSLRRIASVGEALNPEVIRWSCEHLGLPVHDTWFQTETGCILIANLPGMEIKPGSMGKPIPPVEAEILDDDFNPLPQGAVGHIAIRAGWPSMFTAYWNNEEAYLGKFKKGWYLTGDKGKKDGDGYFWFVGREDDVINTAGHLVSPFEVESVLVQHLSVAEAVVVSLPDPMLGEKIKAFIVLTKEAEPSGALKVELRSMVRSLVSPFAVPQEVEFVSHIPRTKSGKLMRRLMRARALGLPEGDTSTLEEDV